MLSVSAEEEEEEVVVTMLSVALLLLLLAAGSSVKCETLTQPTSVTVQPGQRLTINCQVSYSVSTYWTHWIRQPAGKGLKWIGVARVGNTAYYKDSLRSQFSITLDSSSNTVTLSGQNMQPGDTAVYYCASGRSYFFDYWGKGTKVTVSSDQVSSPSVFPLVPCTKSGDEITVGCLAYNFFPDSLTFQWTPDSSVSSVQYPSILNGNKYTAVSLVQVPKSEWISGVSFDCTVNHTGSVSPLISVSITGRVTPPTAITTSVPKVGRQPEVTVHVPPVEVINEGSGEVTMVCLVSSPVQQNYNISWLEYTGRRTENYKRGADSSPVKTRRGYSVSSVYSTTKEKWHTYTFECNVRSKGSNRILQRRAVSSAQLNAIECDR